MTEHRVKAFGAELEALSQSLAQMGGRVEALLADAIEAISRRDTALAERTIAADATVDRNERDVGERVVALLALRQPVAIDLRETVTALKIAADLERIGDLAKNIAKRALALNREPPMRLTQSLVRMGRQALQQLKTVLDAYSRRDTDAAVRVWRADSEIDEHYNSVFRELLTYMMEDPRTIGLCAHLLFVAKNIERIGDHATNLAENVHYLVTGERLADERPKGDMTSTTSIDYETGRKK